MLCRFALAALWLLAVMGFTMPTESTTASWQVLDLVKLAVLATVCVGGAWVLMAHEKHLRLRRVLFPLLPFYAYFGWALLSTFWSPLRSVTVFQSGGLVALLFLASAVGAICTQPQNVSRVLWHLSLVLLASSAVVLMAYLINPTFSGLDRNRIHSGGDGLIHPTAAGATASLGLLLPLLCHVIGRFSWPKKWWVPCLLIHGSILLLSNSRTATGMAILTMGPILFWYSTNRTRAKFMAGIGALCLIMVLVDPGFKWGTSTAGASAAYVSRGQSGDQMMKGVSGRDEMWSAIWNEYEKALLIGHGYFVTSETGSLLVWNQSHNYTAHNLVLQVLVTTGATGLLIFGFALLQPILAISLLRQGDHQQRQLLAMIAVLSVWYVGWAQLGISFMGPVRPESIVFFTMLGIGVGRASGMGATNGSHQVRSVS